MVGPSGIEPAYMTNVVTTLTIELQALCVILLA